MGHRVDTPKPTEPSSAAEGLIPHGTVIAGRYLVEELLGAGGMGTVYAAHDQLIDQPVAVKFIKASFAKSPRMMDALRQEVRLSQRVTHHNVARTYTMEESEGRLFVVMELLRGRRLSDEIADGPLPVVRAVEIAHQVALGLFAAHERDVIHRDIKPQNVALCENGRAVVMDFGIARVLGASSTAEPGRTSGVRQTSFGGTPGYMAPEAFRGDPVGPSADLYGVGLLLYEMLVGAPPFVSDDPVALMMMHVEELPTRLDALRAEVPAGVADITQKLLAKEPGQRFQSANELARALARFTPHSDASRFGSAPQSVLSLPHPTSTRGPNRPFAVLAVLLSLLIAAWYFLLRTADTEPRTMPRAAKSANVVATLPAREEERVLSPREEKVEAPKIEAPALPTAVESRPLEAEARRKHRVRERESLGVEAIPSTQPTSGATQRRRRLLDLEE